MGLNMGEKKGLIGAMGLAKWLVTGDFFDQQKSQ